MGLNEDSKKLIKAHYNRKNDLNFDGLINEECYKKSEIKILFVLKEGWGVIGSGLSIIEALNKAICVDCRNFGKFNHSTCMFNRMAEWSYGILTNNSNYDEVCRELFKIETTTNKSYQHPLCSVGLINISKDSRPTVANNWKKLLPIFTKNRELLKAQIELLEPDVIICGGIIGECYGIADWIANIFVNGKITWYGGTLCGVTLVDVKGKKTGIISSYHPAKAKKKGAFFKDIMSSWKILQSLNPLLNNYLYEPCNICK